MISSALSMAAMTLISVRRNLGAWLQEVAPRMVTDRELLERMVRIEEELKLQRELMQQGFAAVDKRFEDMNKRFDDMHRSSTRCFTVLTVMVALIGLSGVVVPLLPPGSAPPADAGSCVPSPRESHPR